MAAAETEAAAWADAPAPVDDTFAAGALAPAVHAAGVCEFADPLEMLQPGHDHLLGLDQLLGLDRLLEGTHLPATLTVGGCAQCTLQAADCIQMEQSLAPAAGSNLSLPMPFSKLFAVQCYYVCHASLSS